MIDKSLYQAPMGLDSLEEPPIEIDIEDPEAVNISMGDIEISLTPEPKTNGESFDANLAEHMDESALQ